MQPPLPSESTSAARGRAAGEAFDERLRDRETTHRHRRIAELSGLTTPEGDELVAAWREEGVPQVELELQELRAHLAAISGSRVWRAAQALRGLVGRRW